MVLKTINLQQRAANEGRRILAWWRENALRTDGSFYGKVTNDCIPDPNADLGVILATRILWTFSRAIHSGFETSMENRQVADHLWTLFKSAFWDTSHLGVFWMVNGNQQPVQRRKHIYAQSFAMYACAEYYAASGNPEALLYAQLIYECVERFARDSVHGGYFESFSEDWNPIQDQLGISDLAAPKSMNTHLHLLEAYTRLYQVWPNPELRYRLRELLQVVITRIVHPQTFHFQLFFDADWRPLSDVISYGHDIEGSWLLCEAAEALGDRDCIESTRDLAVQMVKATIAEGIDMDGGLFNEGRAGRVIDDDKHWWPQAEAAVGLVNAYQITDDPQYLDKSQLVWDFIEQYIADKQYGEWFWLVDRDGNPDMTKWKVEPWKCPYHNTRACMELWQRLAVKGE
ncbi:cellobiose 2-epimerase [Alicyclobacillus hesperidum]|uniref:Cellobiose 2-epimerase n=1 Tax=Alicyclobacillus hesperidum TaxID=89784 RepID=A0A1H2RYD4_9BACL|nr:AGE family epimerase/isomerase [Alicyclobacillus hesperidum]GLV13415.1 cellobiose 2-epimerase [Alicyclobacillus hesperidum]SDW24486.1 mannobiose 2-epimerase [Alicyclobacillus hesperidum]